jgi:streptogramin lyase
MKLFLLLCLALHLSHLPVGAQQNAITFEHLTSAQGLSHGTVTSIIQDKEGFMWFGTKAGLNRYDGHNFQVYQHDPTATNSLSDNTIRSICEDRAGLLWIGTTRGLNQFDKRSNTVRRFNNTPAIMPSGRFMKIVQGSSGSVLPAD